MTIDEFIRGIDRIIDNLPDILQGEMETIALDGKVFVQNRIQESGINDKGNPLKAYSDNKLPAFFFTDPDRPKRLSKEEAANYPDGISYVDYRKAKGLPVDRVTLTVTGEMWRSIGIVEEREDDGTYIAFLGGRDQETINKIAWNYKDRPFMSLNDDELEIIRTASGSRVRSKFIELL